MRYISTMLLLPVCLALLGGTCFADYVQIKYRSGKIQTILLDEPSSAITSIRYQEDSAAPAVPASGIATKFDVKDSANDAEAATLVPGEKAKTDSKSPVRFEWAQPLE
jgi:hypothetical protein